MDSNWGNSISISLKNTFMSVDPNTLHSLDRFSRGAIQKRRKRYEAFSRAMQSVRQAVHTNTPRKRVLICHIQNNMNCLGGITVF